jgi:hypothetical protein
MILLVGQVSRVAAEEPVVVEAFVIRDVVGYTRLVSVVETERGWRASDCRIASDPATACDELGD